MLEIQIAFCSAVVAYVYAEILISDGNILDWLGDYFDKQYTDAANNDKSVKKKVFYMIRCPLCMSGQFALWSYLIIAPFNIISLIFTISLSILLAKIIQRWS